MTGEYVSIVVGPRLRESTRVHGGVRLIYRSRRGSPPADDARRQILPYTEEDIPGRVLDAAERAIDLLPGARGTIVLVEAPLRLELASAHPGGMVLVSDRLFRIFPVRKFRKFHERELVRAARVWMDRFGRAGDVYRFDCVGITDGRLEHLEDAFRPGWR